MSCLTEAETPTRWEKLAAHDQTTAVTKLPPFWEPASRNGKKPGLELKTNCTWDNQDDTRQTTGDHSQVTIRADCAISACSPLPQSRKALAPDGRQREGGGGESAFGQESAHSPSCWHWKQSRASFPPTLPHYWLSAWQAAGCLFIRVPFTQRNLG